MNPNKLYVRTLEVVQADEEFWGLIVALQKAKVIRIAKGMRGEAAMTHRKGNRNKK